MVQAGRWTDVNNGGYPDFKGPTIMTTDPGATATWRLDSVPDQRGWDQVEVDVFIPNTGAGAWVRYSVTAEAGSVTRTAHYDVPQQPNSGWYQLPGTFRIGAPTSREGAIKVTMTYLQAYTGPAVDESCPTGACNAMATGQVRFVPRGDA
jgi:hypothetical protein